jgi:hypothetical protein
MAARGPLFGFQCSALMTDCARSHSWWPKVGFADPPRTSRPCHPLRNQRTGWVGIHYLSTLRIHTYLPGRSPPIVGRQLVAGIGSSLFFLNPKCPRHPPSSWCCFYQHATLLRAPYWNATRYYCERRILVYNNYGFDSKNVTIESLFCDYQIWFEKGGTSISSNDYSPIACLFAMTVIIIALVTNSSTND